MNHKVIILGGGVAGMSAAHELVERGFEVEVYEKKTIPGGKARSINVPDTSVNGSLPLPGEHGFRFFPRFYKHLPDTMSRIPDKLRGHSVFENLVEASRAEIAEFGKAPIIISTRFPRNLQDLEVMLNETFGNDSGLTQDDLTFFAGRLWQLMTSCWGRRTAEYEKISWWDFVDAEQRSEAYQTFLATGLTRSLVAAKAGEISTKTGGDILLQLIFDIATPGVSSDRLLSGPTNDVFINAWREYLISQGVKYHHQATVKNISCDGKKILGVEVELDGQVQTVKGDYYISAMPVEVFAPLITEEMVAADPSLVSIRPLSKNVAWMNGIQFFLNKDVEIIQGHTIYINSEWALTSVSQAQFWKYYPMSEFGDGEIKTVLSVDISDWDAPGDQQKKPAKDCTAEEIKNEVIHQLEKSLDVNEGELLTDDMIVNWFLDPDIEMEKKGPNPDVNTEPLLINVKDSWRLRPEAVTQIPNLFLASDYVRTYTDLATMEGANEAARRAVNGILVKSGSNAEPCEIWNLHEPDILWPWRAHDQARFKKGLPWDGDFVDIDLDEWEQFILKNKWILLGAALGVVAGGFIGNRIRKHLMR